MSTGEATVESPSPAVPAAPFEAFLSSILVGRQANRSAADAPTSPTSPSSGDNSASSSAAIPPQTAATASTAETAVNAKSTADATQQHQQQSDSPSLSSTSTPPSPPSTSSSPSSPTSSSSSSSSGVTGATAGNTTPPTETTDERLQSSSTRSTSPTPVNTSKSDSEGDGMEATHGDHANSTTANGSGEAGKVAFDVTSRTGREALLLRFLQLLPDIQDLQLPLNQPHVGGGDDEESKACQQLLSEVVVALRLWVVQQPLTLGRPLSDDNPSLFALLRPQLGHLHWWRAPTHTARPSRYPTTSASTSSSAPPVPPHEDDLLALAWGNRAADASAAKSHEGSPASSPPLPSSHVSVPVVKIEQPHSGNGAFAHHVHGTPTVIGTIKMAGPNNSNNDNEGFEFNENDSALVPPSGNSLSKRRRSMDATLEVAGIMARQPARDQALRKRRKSVLDRTSAANVIAQQEENVVGRDLRKRKGAPDGSSSSTSTTTTTASQQNPDRRSESDGGLSPKKIKFDDEDYVDNGNREAEKEKEAHSDTADSATPVRGRGARGRGTRGVRPRGGRGGRGANREKDLEGVPKTKARKPESCHRCKNKKEFWVGCPLVASHKYCRGCVVRHFSIDYDDFRANPEKYWTDGCPICHLTCPCIGCVRKKKNGQQDGGNEEDRVDIEKDDEDEVGDPDEDEDEGDLDGYGDGEDEDGDGGGEEDDVHVDVDNDDISEEKSVESLIEVKWSALKRQLDVKDASSSAADGLDGGGQGHLPVKKRMSRLRSNSFASGHGPSSRTSSSSSSSSSSSVLDGPSTPPVQQPPRKRSQRLRSYSTSHCPEPKPSTTMNPEDFLGRTGAGNVLAARYSSPMRRGSRGSNSRGNH